MNITPQPGQCLAVIGNTELAKAIDLFEILQEFKEGEKCQYKINHIAGIITDKNGILSVCECLANGVTITPWTESEYFRNEKQYLLIDYIVELNSLEKLNFVCWGRDNEGKGYDFIGIGFQILFTVFGWWLRPKNDNPNRYYCSEI